MANSYRPPRSRQQWLLSIFLLAVLVYLSFTFLLNPQRENEKKFDDAKVVPVSPITPGYAPNESKVILIRDNKVYATDKDDSVVQSYKDSAHNVSDLVWNDPRNST